MALQTAVTSSVGVTKVWVLPAAPTTYGYYFPWSLNFVEEPRLIPRRAQRQTRGRGAASFEYLRAYRDEGAGLINLPGNVVPGAYVAITMGVTAFAHSAVVWWGYITTVEKTGFAGAIDVNGEVSAVGIGQLLEANFLTGFRQDGHGAAGKVMLSAPTANMSTEAGEIVGNKATGLDDLGASAPVFADTPAGCGTHWSAYDVLDHVLRFCSPAGIPAITLSGSTGIATYLQDTTAKEVFEIGQSTMSSLLDTILSRPKGFGWDVAPLSNGKWNVYAYALNDNATAYGSGYPSQTATNIDVSGSQIAQVRYTEDATDLVDSVTVEGGNIIIGATVAYDDNNLSPGWSTTQEALYKTGASGDAGYAAKTPDQKKEANNQIRAAPGLRDVYELFGLYPSTSALTRSATPGLGAGSLPLVPNISWSGTTATVDDSTSRLPYLPSLRLARTVPWPAGIKADGTDTRAPSQAYAPAYLEPRVFRYNPSPPTGEGLWQDLLLDFRKRSSPSVSIDDRGPGLRISFTPREMFAKNNWTTGVDAISKLDPINADPYARPVDYLDLVCTIGIPSDQKISVTKYRDGLLASTARRAVRLSYERLQCWVVLAGTVLGVDSSGNAERVLTNTFTRNDWAQAERLATLYAAWFFRKRNSAVIELALPSSPPAYASIGTLIGQITERAQFGNTTALVTNAYTVVESMDYDFSDSPRLTLATTIPDNPLFASGVGASPAMGGSVSASLGGTPAQCIKQGQIKMESVKAQMQRSPVVMPRIAESVSTGNTIIDTGVTQAAHGFSIGDIVYNNAGTWAKAKADVVGTAGYAGVIQAVTTNTFDVVYGGIVTSQTGIAAGTVYYLSGATAGGKVARASLGATGLRVPVMVGISSTTALVFMSSQISSDMLTLRSGDATAGLGGMLVYCAATNKVTIDAADFVGTGRDVRLREIDVCVSGVAKKMLILASAAY